MKRFLPYLLIIVLLILIKNNISSIFKSISNANITADLKKKISEEKKKNEFYKQQLYYVKTNGFVEDVAQNKLGLLRKNEYFVIAPTPPAPGILNPNIDIRPNWKKWWDLFF